MTLKRMSTASQSSDSPPLPLPIRLITHNIRYATTRLSPGEQPWSTRQPLLSSQLHFTSINQPTTFICLQEVLNNQLLDILTSFNSLSPTPSLSSSSSSSAEKPWASIGVGRDDGKEAGEYSPILYQPATWDLLSTETKWLSPTPNQPSRGWDAACTRIVTIGHFRHRASNRKILILNTHFDHVGIHARVESAALILQIIAERSSTNTNSDPKAGGNDETRPFDAVFLAGDFNSPPDDGAYLVMTSQQSSMEDIASKVPENRKYGNELTFTGFRDRDRGKSRIDFLFARKEDKVRFETYAVLPNKFDGGVAVSDHRAVVVDVKVE